MPPRKKKTNKGGSHKGHEHKEELVVVPKAFLSDWSCIGSRGEVIRAILEEGGLGVGEKTYDDVGEVVWIRPASRTRALVMDRHGDFHADRFEASKLFYYCYKILDKPFAPPGLCGPLRDAFTFLNFGPTNQVVPTVAIKSQKVHLPREFIPLVKNLEIAGLFTYNVVFDTLEVYGSREIDINFWQAFLFSLPFWYGYAQTKFQVAPAAGAAANPPERNLPPYVPYFAEAKRQTSTIVQLMLEHVQKKRQEKAADRAAYRELLLREAFRAYERLQRIQQALGLALKAKQKQDPKFTLESSFADALQCAPAGAGQTGLTPTAQEALEYAGVEIDSEKFGTRLANLDIPGQVVTVN